MDSQHWSSAVSYTHLDVYKRQLQEGLKEWFRLAARGAGLDMSYFYNVLNYTPEEGLVQEETQLLLYRGIEPYLDPDIDLEKCPVTEEMDCVYSVMESPRPLPDLSLIHI